MGELIRIFGGRMAESSLAAAIIAAITALAMIATRQPARRRALARAGVLACMLAVPIAALRVAPAITIPGLSPAALRQTASWLAERLGGVERIAAVGGRGVFRLGVALMPAVMLAGYLFVVFVGLARLFLAWWGSGWVARHSTAASSETYALYAALPHPAHLRRPGLRVSGRIKGPVLLGTFRPVILLPPEYQAEEAADSLRLALAHELAHAEASDPWFCLAVDMALVLWFWMPPLWWIRRQMRLDQEFLADRRASHQLGSARRYATSLVEIAESQIAPAGADVGGAAREAATALIRRVTMLVRCPFPVETKPPRPWRLGLIAGWAFLITAATGVSVQQTSGRSEDVRAASGPRSLAIARMVVEAGPSPGAPTTLPIRLPERFEIQLDVFAAPSDLPHIQILDQPLGEPTPPGNPFVAETARWHRVRLKRHGDPLALDVEVGGGTFRSRAIGRRDAWLTVLPRLDHRLVLRSIQVGW